MSLTLQNYKIDTEEYPIYIYIDNEKNIWLKGIEVAKILGYECPKMAFKHVHIEDRRNSFDLIGKEISLPDKWHPQTIMINENGLNQLIMKCKKPLAKAFQRWVCGEIIPSVLRTGAYISPNINNDQINNQIATLLNTLKQREEERLEDRQMMRKFQEQILDNNTKLMTLSNKLVSVAPRVAVMPYSKKKQNGIQIYKNNISDTYRFIRTQNGSISQAIKKVNLKTEDLVWEKYNLPNTMGILNRVKEIIGIGSYTSVSNNMIISKADILDVIEKIFLTECLNY